jgi:hypothetical protein
VDDPVDDDDAPIPTRPGPAFRRRTVTIPAQATVPFVEQDWHDALVLIQRGAVDLCCARGGRRRFAKGAVLFLDGLGLTALHNPGVEDVELVALSRVARG